MEAARVLIINAYSSDNHGDGLLVDLAIRLCQEALGVDASLLVAAHYPESFDDRRVRVISPFGSSSPANVSMRGLAALLSGGRRGFSREFVNAAQDASLLLSVGGGYMRGGRRLELLKCVVIHCSQMRLASRLARTKSWVLLPQSIGPFGPFVARWLRRTLRPALRVYVRDDKSFLDLSVLNNIVRVADCAVLEIDHTTTRKRHTVVNGSCDGSSAVAGLILRRLSGASTYDARVSELLMAHKFLPILQSSVGGNDDSAYYGTLSLRPDVGLSESITLGRIDSCLSVRLHGAIECIMAGVPAIHLSYERKGYAAYQDLHLEEYVFDARNFDVEKVSTALRRVQDDPVAFWRHVESSAEVRRCQRRKLVAFLKFAEQGSRKVSGAEDGDGETGGGLR